MYILIYALMRVVRPTPLHVLTVVRDFMRDLLNNGYALNKESKHIIIYNISIHFAVMYS